MELKLPILPGRFDVLSSRVDSSRTEEIVARILFDGPRRIGTTLTYHNAFTLLQVDEDPHIAETLPHFDLCYADGIGAVFAWVLTRGRRMRKVTANDFFIALCEEIARHGLFVAFIGGQPGVTVEMSHRLWQQFPSLNVVRASCGFLDEKDEKRLLEDLKESDPAIVFVGMGQPRQEEWALRVSRQFPRTVIHCVGGLFDNLSGRVPLAPSWMRKSGFEWLFQFLIRPRTMWRRYLLGVPKLFLLILKSYYSLSDERRRRSTELPSDSRAVR